VSTDQARPLSPRQVFERIQHISLHRDTPVADLYAVDGVHEWPFPFPGAPRRLSGQDEIRGFFSRVAGSTRFEFREFRDVVVHETTDPEVIIAEYDIRGQVTDTGRPFVFSYILVLRVRDGRIVSLRDYLNPAAMSEAVRS
jgi:ketosteroid isomerase-like protein